MSDILMAVTLTVTLPTWSLVLLAMAAGAALCYVGILLWVLHEH